VPIFSISFLLKSLRALAGGGHIIKKIGERLYLSPIYMFKIM